MKLLIVMPCFPSPTWGMGTRNFYLLKALATRHSVSLLCLIDRVDIEGCDLSILKDLVHQVKFVARPTSSQKRLLQLAYMARGRSYSIGMNYSLEMQEALTTLLTEEHYDAVLFESVLIAGYHLPKGVMRVIDQHNIEYELHLRMFQSEAARLRRWYNSWESHLLRPVEIKLCKQADLVLTTSERDRQSLKKLLPYKNIEVVPNGVDTEVFQSNRTEEIPYQIIFTGSMNYYPNVDAVCTFAKQCWPHIKAEFPDATWKIVGSQPTQEVRRLAQLPGVTVTGTVPDVLPYLAASAVAIVPLQVGGGTRLKILEAFSMGRAVVSTSVGREGLSVVPGKHLMIADCPEEFVSAVLTLLNNPDKRSTLGNAGRALVEAEYSWEYCGNQLLQVLETHFEEREAYASTTSA